MPSRPPYRPTGACADWSNVELVSAPIEDDPAPEPPKRPFATDCCGGGCSPCVFEIYEQKVARYEEALRAWRLRNPDEKR